jgi:hypothetical protein
MIAFRRVVIVVLENASRDTVLANQYMSDLRKKGVFLSNSHGVTHPSQPNYFAMTGGDTLGMVTDDPGWVQWATVVFSNPVPPVYCIADLLDRRGLSWKAYAECLTQDDMVYATDPLPVPADGDFPFARRHVPFLSYPHIMQNKEYADLHIVNAADNFELDLAAGRLPHYSFYVPNLINDGHSLPPYSLPPDPMNNCNETTDKYPPAHPIEDKDQLLNIEAFLKNFLGDDPVSKFPPETLIVITFDESYGAAVPYNIYTLLIGDMLEAGTVRHEPYNHYSLLRTIEENFGLGTLGRNDAAATPYWFVKPLAH